MNTLTRKWLEYAKADLEAAVVLVKSGKTHYSYQAAVMHCHQAVEKMLKTLIVSNNEAPKRIHDLIGPVAQAPKHRAGLRYKTVLLQRLMFPYMTMSNLMSKSYNSLIIKLI